MRNGLTSKGRLFFFQLSVTFLECCITKHERLIGLLLSCVYTFAVNLIQQKLWTAAFVFRHFILLLYTAVQIA